MTVPSHDHRPRRCRKRGRRGRGQSACDAPALPPLPAAAGGLQFVDREAAGDGGGVLAEGFGGHDVTAAGDTEVRRLRVDFRGRGAVWWGGAMGRCNGGEGDAEGSGAASVGLITDRWRGGIGDGACVDGYLRLW